MGAGELGRQYPRVTAITNSMKACNAQLQPAYQSGAVGFAKDGNVAVRDAGALPLKDRAAISGLVAQENQDRAALYKEIAKANGHPDGKVIAAPPSRSATFKKPRPDFTFKTAATTGRRKSGFRSCSPSLSSILKPSPIRMG